MSFEFLVSDYETFLPRGYFPQRSKGLLWRMPLARNKADHCTSLRVMPERAVANLSRPSVKGGILCVTLRTLRFNFFFWFSPSFYAITRADQCAGFDAEKWTSRGKFCL